MSGRIVPGCLGLFLVLRGLDSIAPLQHVGVEQGSRVFSLTTRSQEGDTRAGCLPRLTATSSSSLWDGLMVRSATQ